MLINKSNEFLVDIFKEIYVDNIMNLIPDGVRLEIWKTERQKHTEKFIERVEDILGD